MSLDTRWAQCPTGMQVEFYYSDDGGARWTLIDPVSQISATGDAYFDPVSSNLAYLDVGLFHFGLYRITNDAHAVTFVGTCKGADEFVFTNEADGLALGHANDSPASRLFRTTNAGVTWTRVANF